MSQQFFELLVSKKMNTLQSIASSSDEYFLIHQPASFYTRIKQLFKKSKYFKAIHQFYERLQQSKQRQFTLEYLKQFSDVQKAFIKLINNQKYDFSQKINNQKIMQIFNINLQNYYNYLVIIIQIRDQNKKAKKYYDDIYKDYLKIVQMKSADTEEQVFDSDDIKWTYNLDEIFQYKINQKDCYSNNNNSYQFFSTFEQLDRQQVDRLSDIQLFKFINKFFNLLFQSINVVNKIAIKNNVEKLYVQIFLQTDKIIDSFQYYHQIMEKNFFQFCYDFYIIFANYQQAKKNYTKTIIYYQKAIKMQQCIIKRECYQVNDDITHTSSDSKDQNYKRVQENYLNIVFILQKMFDLTQKNNKICKGFEIFQLINAIINSKFLNHQVDLKQQYQQFFNDY